MKKRVLILMIALLAIFTLTSCSKKFTVTFDSDGGSAVAAVEVKKGKTVAKPTDPTKNGSIFEGWTLDGANYDFSTKVKSNITLKAKWTVKKVTITFDANGGQFTGSRTVEVDFGKSVALPTEPSRTGYDFDGWTLNGTAYDFSKAVTENITLKAKWAVKTVNVTFNANGGSFVGDTKVEVEVGKPVAKPADPTNPGFDFDGWTLNGVRYDFAEALDANAVDFELVANWKVKKATVTFNADGGEFTGDTKVEVEVGKPVAKPVDPTKNGFDFAGWMLNGAAYDFSQAVNEDITLVAKWDQQQGVEYVTITFNVNGGTPVEETVIVKGGFLSNIASYNTTKVGYDFAGWYLDAECTQALPDNYAFESDVTLYAKWDIKKLTVTFDAADGVFTGNTTSEVEYGKTVAQPAEPTKEGYNFVGWMLNGEAYDFVTPATEDITLVAKWQVKKAIVTFDANGGVFTGNTTVEVEIGQSVVQPAAPTREKHKFIGWMLNGEVFDFTTPVTKDITLVAKWKETGVYHPNWDPAKQVGGWQGLGMDVKIMVLPASSFDPFNAGYTNTNDQKVKQQHQRIVESAYDISIVYEEWGNNAAWGPDRIQFIKDSVNGYFSANDIYVLNITSSWIPTLVRDNCLAELYNTASESGIFAEVGYQETSEGSGVYVPGPYEQDPANNQATVTANVIYGYAPGKSRPDYFMYFNADIIKNSGLEDPAELWFKGEWTWSKFEQYVSQLQVYLNTLSTDETEYKALALGYPEFFIGSCGSTSNRIATPMPARLNLTSTGVVDQLTKIQSLVNSGAYDKTRGTYDVAPSFTQGRSVFVHGDLWFVNDPSRFPKNIGFEIGCVPYPTADGDTGTVLTTDNLDRAIYTSSGEPLTNEDDEYISGIDMSETSFGVPFTYTHNCYSIVNTPNGKNGINNKIIFAIMYDLYDGQGPDPDAPKQTEDEAYRTWLLTGKFQSPIYADVIMSVQDNTYFELIDMVSMSVGGGSQFGPNALWVTLPGICTDSQKSPQAELAAIRNIYAEQMKRMGYYVS